MRYELISDIGLKYLAEVYTKGAHKYSTYENSKGEEVLGVNVPIEEVHKLKVIYDASNNWRKGLSWMETLGSVERHIKAFKSGEEIDPELKTRHLANAAWGLFTLMDFEKSFPQGDDRPHTYLKTKKIGLDIDEVLADFVGAYCKRFNVPEAKFWSFDWNLKENTEKLKQDKDFWLNIPPLIKPEELPFEPHAYITTRQCDEEWTKQWLSINGFPLAPFYKVTKEETKVDAAKHAGIDIFVDDGYHNFVELNKAGICTYLYSAPHNERYNVGHKRIKSLKELV